MRRLLPVAVLLAAVTAFAQDKPAAKPEEKPAAKPADASAAKPAETPPAAPVGAGLKPKVVLTTTLGDITLELDGDKAPITTLNFLQYVDSGFYNGKIFHRVIPTFMAQAGGFNASMDEVKEGLRPPIKNESNNGLSNVKGTISMARTNDPNSATAQFFINLVDNNVDDRPNKKINLDAKGGAPGYAVFGKVVDGMDTLEKIKSAKMVQHPKYSDPAGAVTPDPLVVINSAKVIADVDRKKLEEASVPSDVRDYVKKAEGETGKKFDKTPTGIYSAVLKEGTGTATPQPTQTVKVLYTGTLLNGAKFDSTDDHQPPGPIEFKLNGVIQGWTQGVGMMKVGEKRRLVIPPELAYGSRPPPSAPGKTQIPPNAWLVFDVELLEIK